MITQVQITEGADVTNYAQFCPTGQDRTQWLGKLVQDAVLAPSNLRRFSPVGMTRLIDRANVTSVTVTTDAN